MFFKNIFVSGRKYGPNRKLSIEGEDWPGRNTGGAGWSGEPGEVLGCHQFTPKLGDSGF